MEDSASLNSITGKASEPPCQESIKRQFAATLTRCSPANLEDDPNMTATRRCRHTPCAVGSCRSRAQSKRNRDRCDTDEQGTVADTHLPLRPPPIVDFRSAKVCLPPPSSCCTFVARPYATKTTGTHSLGRGGEPSAQFEAETPPASTSLCPRIAKARPASRSTPQVPVDHNPQVQT
jgi:hypothetical protein